jgi:hypothetical protein
MSRAGVITLFDEHGEAKDYKKLSFRLPEFLKKYPKEEGYQVVIEKADMLDMKPALKALYLAAISAGVDPKTVGLPEIKNLAIVFTATLRRGGVDLESGSALVPILEYKDWEKGETAARQRLLSALGFGGEVLDADEAADQKSQGLSSATAAPATVAFSKARAEKAGPVKREEASDAETEAGEEAEEVQDQATKAKTAAPTGVPAALIRQIEHQATLLGIETPQVSSTEEAKKVLKDLLSTKK